MPDPTKAEINRAVRMSLQHAVEALQGLEDTFLPKDYELALVAKHKTLPTAHVVVSSMSHDEIRETISEMEAQEADGSATVIPPTDQCEHAFCPDINPNGREDAVPVSESCVHCGFRREL